MRGASLFTPAHLTFPAVLPHSLLHHRRLGRRIGEQNRSELPGCELMLVCVCVCVCVCVGGGGIRRETNDVDGSSFMEQTCLSGVCVCSYVLPTRGYRYTGTHVFLLQGDTIRSAWFCSKGSTGERRTDR